MSDGISDRSLTILGGGRRGRKPRDEEPSITRTFRFSPTEIARLEEAAKANRQTASAFARDAIVTATEELLESPRRRRD